MPYTIRTKDGIEVTGIPENIPADDQRLKDYVASLRAAGKTGAHDFSGYAGQATPSAVAPAWGQREAESMREYDQYAATQPQAEQGKPQTTVEGLMGGVVRGAGPIAAGAGIGAAMGAPFAGVGAAPGAVAGAGLTALAIGVGDPIVRGINSLFGTDWQTPTEAMEDLFTRIGVAQPRTEAEKIVQLAAGGAAGAGGTAALGKTVAQYGGTKLAQLVGQAIGAQPVQQIAGGAGSAAAAEYARKQGASPLVQAGAGLAGGIAGSALTGIRLAPPPAAPVAEAERAGIRLLTTDVRKPNTFASRWLQGVGEKIPVVGTGPLRQAQQVERIDAVRDIIRQFGADDLAAASDDVMKDLLGKRAGDVAKWTAAKGEVIKNVGAGAPVQVPRTIQALDDQIAQLKGLRTTEVAPVIARLEDWKAAIQNQDLPNVELLRKQIGESFKAPDLAAVRSTGERALSGIYGALKDDMTDYIRANGGEAAINKWMVANRELSKMMDDLEIPALKAALDRGETTPEMISNLLFSKRKSDVEALYRNLTPQGQASARAAVLARAAEKAGGYADVSPDKFANEIKRLGDQVGVMFNGDDLLQVRGLVRVLDATKRAGQAAVMPPTGVQAVLPAGAAALASFFGGGLEGFLGTMAAGAGVGGAARLYESKAVRDILAKIPMVTAGGAEEAALFKRLLAAAQAVKEEE